MKTGIPHFDFKIIGKYESKLIWRCSEGFYHEYFMSSSGSLCCKHTEGSCWFDFLDVNSQQEITDEEIIKQIIAGRPRRIEGKELDDMIKDSVNKLNNTVEGVAVEFGVLNKNDRIYIDPNKLETNSLKHCRLHMTTQPCPEMNCDTCDDYVIVIYKKKL